MEFPKTCRFKPKKGFVEVHSVSKTCWDGCIVIQCSVTRQPEGADTAVRSVGAASPRTEATRCKTAWSSVYSKSRLGKTRVPWRTQLPFRPAAAPLGVCPHKGSYVNVPESSVCDSPRRRASTTDERGTARTCEGFVAVFGVCAEATAPWTHSFCSAVSSH